MPLARRELLLAAGALPVGLAIGAIASTTALVLRSAAAGLRPPASGTSASRCAVCGASDHTMLAPSCPMARTVI